MPVNTRRSGLSVLLPTAGMEICRLYAAVSLLFLIPGAPPYSFAALACVLTTGTLLGRGLSFVSQRRIAAFLVYGLFCALFVFLFARPRHGYAFWARAFATGFFYLRGVTLGAGGVSRSKTLTRYDIGIGVFFFIYFLRMYMQETDLVALRVVGAYFLFSILAMAASRSWEMDESFTGSRPAISLVIPFAAVFFLAASALVLLYPLLTQAAGTVYTFLRDNSGPVVAFLTALLRFLFGFGRRGPPAADSLPEPITGEIISIEPSDYGILDKILKWVLIAAGAVMVVVVLVVFIRILVHYLMARKGPQGGDGLLASLKRLLCYIVNRLAAVLRAISVSRLGRHKPLAGMAQEAFRRLCVWGRVSGIPRRICETPAEYACRLGARFPAAGNAAALLAKGLEEELYGGRPPSDTASARLKAAQRDLADISLIPARLFCRLGFQTTLFNGGKNE